MFYFMVHPVYLSLEIRGPERFGPQAELKPRKPWTLLAALIRVIRTGRVKNVSYLELRLRHVPFLNSKFLFENIFRLLIN